MTDKVSKTPLSGQWWKIALCLLGVVMIAGAITYTLMSRATASSASSGNSASQASASNTQTSGGVGELNWVNALRTKYSATDFIFVVFPGDSNQTSKVEQSVKSAAEKMRQDGPIVESMTLPASDPEFSVTLERLGIQKLPAVLLMVSTGQGAIVKGEINETKLLQAYLTLVKTCTPGSSCCPGK